MSLLARLIALVFLVLATCFLHLHREEGRLLPAPDGRGRWGYISEDSGRMLIPARYDRADMFHSGYAVVHRTFEQDAYSVHSLYGEAIEVVPRGDGVIDRQGREVLVPVDYQFVEAAVAHADRRMLLPPVIPGLFAVQNARGRGVLHAEKGWLLPLGRHGDIRFFHDGSFTYDGRWYVDAAGDPAPIMMPEGWSIAEFVRDADVFLLQDEERRASEDHWLPSGNMAMASSSGELLTTRPYRNIFAFPACGRFAGFVPPDGGNRANREDGTRVTELPGTPANDRLPGGSLDILDAGGAVLQTLAQRRQPVTDGRVLGVGRKHADREEPGLVDPCTLMETPGRLEQPPKQPSEYKTVLRNGKSGMEDGNGTEIVPASYEMVLPAGYGYWWCRYNGTKRILVRGGSGAEIRMPGESVR